MKHKNLKGSGIVGVIFIIIVSTGFLVILFWMLNLEPTNIIQPTYTQSEVSALMKFNASEFGCDKIDSIENRDEQLVVWCIGKSWVYGSHLFGVYYFSQFDGVKINEEKLYGRCVWVNSWSNGTSYIDEIEIDWHEIETANQLEYDCMFFTYYSLDENIPMKYARTEYRFGERGNVLLLKYFNWEINEYYQLILTQPNVKTLSGWAISENDLATEFCRAKTYDDYKVFESFCKKISVLGSISGAGEELKKNNISLSDIEQKCVEIKTNRVKSFTRGEVVEVDKFINCRNNMFGSGDLCDTKKQKVIRCTGDDGTQKYFEAFK